MYIYYHRAGINISIFSVAVDSRYFYIPKHGRTASISMRNSDKTASFGDGEDNENSESTRLLEISERRDYINTTKQGEIRLDILMLIFRYCFTFLKKMRLFSLISLTFAVMTKMYVIVIHMIF